MAGDIVVANGTLRLVLEFVEVDTSDSGVRVRLQINYNGIHQTFAWTVDQLWIEYDELRKFEDELGEGVEARLRDMSDYPVLHLRCHPSGEELTINPLNERQSLDGEAVVVRLKINSGSIQALHASLTKFPKWW